jgi:hypothetical protein
MKQLMVIGKIDGRGPKDQWKAAERLPIRQDIRTFDTKEHDHSTPPRIVADGKTM